MSGYGRTFVVIQLELLRGDREQCEVYRLDEQEKHNSPENGETPLLYSRAHRKTEPLTLAIDSSFDESQLQHLVSTGIQDKMRGHYYWDGEVDNASNFLLWHSRIPRVNSTFGTAQFIHSISRPQLNE